MKRINNIIYICICISLSYLFNQISYSDDILLKNIKPYGDYSKEKDKYHLISKIKITPNENKLITSSRILEVWDLQTGNKLIEYSGHGDKSWIKSFDISQSGDTVISGSTGKIAKIWNINNGSEIQSFETSSVINRNIKSVYVNGVKFLYSDMVALTANNTGVVQLWNVKNGNEISIYKDLGTIYSVELSPDQETLIIQDLSSFYLLNLSSQEKSGIYWGQNACFINNDPNRIITNDGNIIKIYNILNKKLKLYKEFQLKQYQSINHFSVDPSGDNIIIGKVSYFHPILKTNFIYDRETININSGNKHINFRASIIKNASDYNENMKNTKEYNDKQIIFYPNGEKYITINGSIINIWENN